MSKLIPPGIADQRSKDFLGVLDEVLGRVTPASLVIQDPMNVDARFLPAMVIERSMNDFVLPGMKEEALRQLLADAVQIHVRTGTVKGTRLALAAIGASAHWVQWWQETPKAHHDTHKVTVFFETVAFEGGSLGDAQHQALARRLVKVTKRKSQDIALRFGVKSEIKLHIGAFATSGSTYTAGLPGEDPKINPSKLFMAAAPLFGGRYTAAIEVS